jgi:galactokinase
MALSATASAPARVNLLGEHTDYNFGYVLPTPLPFETTVTLSQEGAGGVVTVWSEAFANTMRRNIMEPAQGNWSDYIVGCIKLLHERGVKIRGIHAEVKSRVPMGAGISSSAAVLVATLRAARDLFYLDPFEYSDRTIAELAHQVEKQYVGVPCGTMDQMVSSLGHMNEAMFYDTQSGHIELVEMPADYEFMIFHCGLKRQLQDAQTGYKQRVAECAKACEMLQIENLRVVSVADLERIEQLPSPYKERARHVVTENQRVLDGVAALKANNIQKFGELMTASHVSQRDDYAVSIPAIDRLVDAALKQGAIGARLTGGGFGGAIVAMFQKDVAHAMAPEVVKMCPDSYWVQ